MFIIWGTKDKEKILGNLGVNWHCAHCDKELRHKVVRRKTWFTLFWIPVIPIISQYFVACPICDYGIKVSKKKFDGLIEKYGFIKME